MPSTDEGPVPVGKSVYVEPPYVGAELTEDASTELTLDRTAVESMLETGVLDGVSVEETSELETGAELGTVGAVVTRETVNTTAVTVPGTTVTSSSNSMSEGAVTVSSKGPVLTVIPSATVAPVRMFRRVAVRAGPSREMMLMVKTSPVRALSEKSVIIARIM